MGRRPGQAVGKGVAGHSPRRWAPGCCFATTQEPIVGWRATDALCHSRAGHPAPGMGVMLSAAGSLQWYRDAPVRECLDSASAPRQDIPPGLAACTSTLPGTGERTPHPTHWHRASICRIDHPPPRHHMTRCFSGFGLRDGMLIRSAGLGELPCAPGWRSKALWRQVLSDVMATDGHCEHDRSEPPYGAALLAGVGAGVWKDVLGELS